MATWFSSDALQLVEARNRREVAAFSDLIASHQQLLFRSALGASSSSLRVPKTQDQNDTAQRYLSAIETLEHELAAKNAQLATYAGQQLALVSESKTLLQEREEWEQKLLLGTKRLAEETALSLEKDKALTELQDALLLAKEELGRLRLLLEQSEVENNKLRARNVELETQLQEKNVLLHEWLQTDHPSPKMATQETAESLSHLMLSDEDALGFVDSETKLVTHVTHSILMEL
ncbi:Hypothetical protein PHPALM_8375 [Phytophthora palmivora]|uniref:Autophagy-related protein 16 domain-containing protein n=1 Tax=Phytophthora palmivora TaxID=4796 RepID=A0A2P4Y9Z7_9STRA|nr:Hypothetical protein PHPALM_8375 [Phytophthora palmivora]